ncbi:MAG: helix-turn-helix domain-containing protein [Aristaeellaceae bacterium]
MDILKKRMRDLREDNDLKQSELADALGLGRSVISVYECGREPPLDVIFKYAEYFDVSVQYLLGLTNEKKPVPKEDEQAIENMQTAAVARGEAAFARSDVTALAAAFCRYYQAGAPAGTAPMACICAFLPAMVRVLDAATSQDVAALLTACDDVAKAGLQITGALGTVLGVSEPPEN